MKRCVLWLSCWLSATSAWSQPTPDVVIVGAGLAGLTTAYELQKHGLDTHVLEAQTEVGGRVSTVDYEEGLEAEYGVQELWSNNPILGIANELGVDLEMSYEHCAHSTFFVNGKAYPDSGDGTMAGHWRSFLAPDEERGLAAWLERAETLHERAARSGLADPRVRALQEMSYEAWVRSSPALSELAQLWLRLTLEAELGRDWSRVSALFALLEMDILFDGGAACYAVKGGNAVLTAALAASSGTVTTSARVTAVEHVDGEGTSTLRVTFLAGDRMKSILTSRVVLAVPFYVLNQILLDPPLSLEHVRALRTLERGHYVSVHLVTDASASELTFENEDVLYEGVLTDGPLGYVYGFVSENDSHAVFSTLVHGEWAERFHRAPRSQKVGELLVELDAMIPRFSEHLVRTHVYTYHPAAVPSWGPGRSPLDAGSALFRRPLGSVYFAGDWTRGAHSDSAVQSGIDVARQIVDDLSSLTTTSRETVDESRQTRSDSESSRHFRER